MDVKNTPWNLKISIMHFACFSPRMIAIWPEGHLGARQPLTTATLRKRTGFDTRRITNAVYRLTKENKIKSPAKGVYTLLQAVFRLLLKIQLVAR